MNWLIILLIVVALIEGGLYFVVGASMVLVYYGFGLAALGFIGWIMYTAFRETGLIFLALIAPVIGYFIWSNRKDLFKPKKQQNP